MPMGWKFPDQRDRNRYLENLMKDFSIQDLIKVGTQIVKQIKPTREKLKF